MSSLAWALRLAVTVGVLVVVPAGPAAAHVAGGAAPSNYSGVITSISASMPGVQVTLSASGDELDLRNDSDVEVLVPGYSEEPYLRIGPDGVQRNDRSPATYLNATVQGDSPLPPQADAEADPEWVTVSSTANFRWHDHRTHWMGTVLPPAVQADPNGTHLISSWQVPLSYGGEPVLINGTLTWTPPPSSLPWTVLAVGLAVAAVALAGRARWQRPMLALLVTLVGVEILHLVLSPLPRDSPVFGVTAESLPTLAALLLTWGSWRSVKAGTSTVGYLAGIAAWLVLLQALPDLEVLWNSQLPAAGPNWLSQLAVSSAVGLGAGVGLGCLRVLTRAHRTAPDSVAQARVG